MFRASPAAPSPSCPCVQPAAVSNQTAALGRVQGAVTHLLFQHEIAPRLFSKRGSLLLHQHGIRLSHPELCSSQAAGAVGSKGKGLHF